MGRPTAEDIAGAYENSVRFELERALGATAGARADELNFVVTPFGCAPAAGDVGHVCAYAYHVEDTGGGGGAGVSAGFVPLVRGHVFPGPDGLVVRELPTPGPLGPQGGLFAGPRP